jgi:hypothetical protein
VASFDTWLSAELEPQSFRSARRLAREAGLDAGEVADRLVQRSSAAASRP